MGSSFATPEPYARAGWSASPRATPDLGLQHHFYGASGIDQTKAGGKVRPRNRWVTHRIGSGGNVAGREFQDASNLLSGQRPVRLLEQRADTGDHRTAGRCAAEGTPASLLLQSRAALHWKDDVIGRWRHAAETRDIRHSP